MSNKDEIFSAVQSCLAGSLAIRASDVARGSRLIDDLGADSLDFIDIIFALEKQFAIKLQGAELDSLLRADFIAERANEQRFMARADIDRLLDWLPALRAAPDLDRVPPHQLFSYITAESLVLLVRKRMEVANC